MQEGLKTRETRMARCARSIVLYFYTGTKRPLKELGATEAGKASCVGIVGTGKAVDSVLTVCCIVLTQMPSMKPLHISPWILLRKTRWA